MSRVLIAALLLTATAGGNKLRVLRDAEAVSGRLRSERGPSQVQYE